MSLLRLPAARPPPQRVATLAAELPAPTFFTEERAGLQVLDMHVAFTPVTRTSVDRPLAFTNLHAAADTSNLRVLGITLDTRPHTSAMLTSIGERAFSVAVAGLVPIAVPGAVLTSVTVGDHLYARAEPADQGFAPNHFGATFATAPPTEVATGTLIGTIYALSPVESYCLVLLHL